MLIRLEDSFIRGELDCRERGRVTGKLWFLGQADPVELDVEGIPSPEMAGLKVRLRCEYPPSAQAPTLGSPQRGHLLACSGASRKKVPLGTDHEIQVRIRKRIPQEWAQRNVVHLEWIDAQGARVVLEAAGVVLQVEETRGWSLNPEEQRAADQRVQRLRSQWADTQPLSRLFLPEVEEESAPLSPAEREADREHLKMEKLNDRIQARLDKVEDFSEEEYEKIYQEERERIRIEFGEPEPEPLTPEQEADQARWVEEMNQLAEEALKEWENGDIVEPDRHPLWVQCDTLQEKITHDLQESGWMPDAPGQEHPLRELNWGLHMATAKLAGGLGACDGTSWPPDKILAGTMVVKLKQVRGYLRDVMTALDGADEENLGVSAWRDAVRDEVNELLYETEALILDLRKTLS